MSFNDLDFYQQQREVDKRWLPPVILAVVAHIATFALSVTLPDILHRKPILDEIVTVNLVSLPDGGGQDLPEQPRVQPVVEKKEPVVKQEKAVPVPVEPTVQPVKAKPVKPVSLKPVKRKVRKTDPAKLARQKRAEERRKALARARQEEKEARQAAEEARTALAEMLRRKGSEKPASTGRRSSGGRQVNSVVEQNYYASLYDRVQQFWVLPEMRRWDAGLETVILVTIRRDGVVTRTVVEKKIS